MRNTRLLVFAIAMGALLLLALLTQGTVSNAQDKEPKPDRWSTVQQCLEAKPGQFAYYEPTLSAKAPRHGEPTYLLQDWCVREATPGGHSWIRWAKGTYKDFVDGLPAADPRCKNDAADGVPVPEPPSPSPTCTPAPPCTSDKWTQISERTEGETRIVTEKNECGITRENRFTTTVQHDCTGGYEVVYLNGASDLSGSTGRIQDLSGLSVASKLKKLPEFKVTDLNSTAQDIVRQRRSDLFEKKHLKDKYRYGIVLRGKCEQDRSSVYFALLRADGGWNWVSFGVGALAGAGAMLLIDHFTDSNPPAVVPNKPPVIIVSPHGNTPGTASRTILSTIH